MSRKPPMVDLMAVRRDREKLAAIVRKYPALRTPEARERLSVYFQEERKKEDAAQEGKGTRRRPVRRSAGK